MSSRSPTVERAIVVTPYLSRSLWRPYLPGSTSRPRARSASARSPSSASRPKAASGRACPPAGRRAAASARLRARRVGAQAHVHALPLSSRRADNVSTEALAGLRLADQQPGLLLQRPAG